VGHHRHPCGSKNSPSVAIGALGLHQPGTPGADQPVPNTGNDPRAGVEELESWLRSRKVRAAGKVATAAVHAASLQHTRVCGEALTATHVADLAGHVLELDRQLAVLDKRISERFHTHRHAAIIASMVGIGDLLRRTVPGGHWRQREHFRLGEPPGRPGGTRLDILRLQPADRQSAPTTQIEPATAAYLLHLSHDQHPTQPCVRAFTTANGPKETTQPGHPALARRRVDVMWAMLHDERTYEEQTPDLPPHDRQG
jgi:hypothetical protein